MVGTVDWIGGLEHTHTHRGKGGGKEREVERRP